MEEIVDPAAMPIDEGAGATIDVVLNGTQTEPLDVLMTRRQEPMDAHPREVIERPWNLNLMLEANAQAIDDESLSMGNRDLVAGAMPDLLEGEDRLAASAT